MAQHTVKGAWTDKSGRRHNFQFQADTTDRATLKDIVREQYPCDPTKAGGGVIINAVMADQVAAENRRREFQEEQERLRSRQSNSADSGYSNSGNSGYEPEQNYSDGGGGISDNISAEGAAGLTIILGVLIAIGWALVTFGAFLTGPLAAFGAYKGLQKVTGKDKEDYEAVVTGQSKSIGSIICLMLILSSGIVGARWGHGAATDYNNDYNNVEQVSQ